MKILLVTLDSKYIHSNLAVRYLKKICKNDFDIDIKEFTINQKQEYIFGELLEADADIICFSCYIWNIEYIKEISYTLKEANKKIKILLGGPEVSFEVKNFMEKQPYIDYVIFGEGEITFREFLYEIHKTKPDFEKIKGLAYKEGSSILINEARGPITNLDIIEYPYEENEIFKDKIIYYESSRGCPFSCSFCMSSIDKTLRNFSMERVKADLQKLLNTKARQIKFVDRTFNADYKRAMEIMDFIVENNHNNMTIHFEITADIINNEFLDYLEKMPVGMFQFEIGVQSLNKKTLNEIDRHMNKKKLFNVINRIKENRNIHMHLDLIAGLPYENIEIFKDSFNGVYELEADKIQLGFLKVLKGTKIYSDKDKHEVKYRRLAPYEVISTKYITAQEILSLKYIEELVDKYYNEKYFEHSTKYIIEDFYSNSYFQFYYEFSQYWGKKDLYKISHSRKKLYYILYCFMKDNFILNEKFLAYLKYDYVFNNNNEELPDYLNRNSEEQFKILKRKLANCEKFRSSFFGDISRKEKIINHFRIVEIGQNIIMFKYEDKSSIFQKCKTYIINDLIKEFENE